MPFFSTLNYSSCNEDGATELAALDIKHGDRVACITGSGDRPLHLLLGNPEKIYAFDANKTQNYLLELKIAAITELDYDSYLAFLGVTKMNKSVREELFHKLSSHLTIEAKSWFLSHKGYIKKGIIYGGRWERYFAMSSKFIQLFRGKKIGKLFSCATIEEQRTFIKSQWDTPLWRLFLRLSFNSFFFRFVFGDPGFYSFIGKNSPGAYIHERMMAYLSEGKARDSFMMALVFYGKFFDEDHYPLYLQKKNFAILKENVYKISISNCNLFDMLESKEGRSCNKFSLSDVSSFLNSELYLKLFRIFEQREAIRFCLRDFLTQRTAPREQCPAIHYESALEKECQRVDTSLGYTFIIGETLS